MSDTSKVRDFQNKLREFGWKEQGGVFTHKTKAGQELRVSFKGSSAYLEAKNKNGEWEKSRPAHITNIRIQDNGKIYWENQVFLNPPKSGQGDYQSISKIIYKHLK